MILLLDILDMPHQVLGLPCQVMLPDDFSCLAIFAYEWTPECYNKRTLVMSRVRSQADLCTS
jgi:hypothetical protein